MIDKALEKMKFDTRLIDTNLNNGFISKEELKKHLEQLPDLSAHVAFVEIEGKSNDDDSDLQPH